MRWSKQNISLPGMSRDFCSALSDQGRRQDQLGVYCPPKAAENILLFVSLFSGDAKDNRRKGRSMTGKTHSATGFFAGLVISHYTGCPGAMTLAMATGSVLGGLLPDIDNVHSQIGNRLPVVELIVHGCQRGIRLLSGILPRKLRECPFHDRTPGTASFSAGSCSNAVGTAGYRQYKRNREGFSDRDDCR